MFVGTLGVIEMAAQMGLIDLKGAFEPVNQTDFWISHKLFLSDSPCFSSAEKLYQTETAEGPLARVQFER